MKENKLREERREGGREKEGKKRREGQREREGGGGQRGKQKRAERPCGPLFTHLPRCLRPTSAWAGKLQSQASAIFSPIKMSALSWLLPSPSPGLRWSALFSLSVSENQQRPHLWTHAWATDCKLFLKEHFAMGFPSPGTILGMSIASVWNKNAESISLINNNIVISCHLDGR